MKILCRRIAAGLLLATLAGPGGALCRRSIPVSPVAAACHAMPQRHRPQPAGLKCCGGRHAAALGGEIAVNRCPLRANAGARVSTFRPPASVLGSSAATAPPPAAPPPILSLPLRV